MLKNDFPVKHVQFGGLTRYEDGVLEVNKEELIELMLDDKRIKRADLDIAFPGESTRIVNVRDVVEPRIKVSGPGCVFPGIMGPVETVGEGRTHKLSGVMVIPSVRIRQSMKSREPVSASHSPASGIIDISGPGEMISPFARTISIVLIFELIDGLSELETTI